MGNEILKASSAASKPLTGACVRYQTWRCWHYVFEVSDVFFGIFRTRCLVFWHSINLKGRCEEHPSLPKNITLKASPVKKNKKTQKSKQQRATTGISWAQRYQAWHAPSADVVPRNFGSVPGRVNAWWVEDCRLVLQESFVAHLGDKMMKYDDARRFQTQDGV